MLDPLARLAKPDSPVNGRLELIRINAANGKVLGRHDIDTESSGSTVWFAQPQFAADGKRLAIGYGSFEFFVFDWPTLKLIRRHGNFATVISPDGRLVMESMLDRLNGYSGDTGKQTFELPIGRRSVLSTSFLPDGKRVLTSGGGGIAHLWDLSKVIGKHAD